jgi:hypothetical protein
VAYTPPPPPAYGQPAPASQSNTPMILSIIGIVCWFCCSPAAIALGLIARSQARNSGQSQTLPNVAWIGGVVALLIGVVGGVINIALNANN